uniref:Ig-like domain-containing protein n=1 Tax=Periophthalmus magnuspinnatus TaxID=409849 RepID=A0A3B4B0D5_9GOBI
MHSDSSLHRSDVPCSSPLPLTHVSSLSPGVPTKPQISGFEAAVPEGEEVTLTCTSSGSKPPAVLHWYRGDKRLAARPDVVESTPGEPTYSVRSEVTLTVSRSDDNALVTCAVVHPSLAPGDKRSEQPLRVLYSPDVKILPQSDLPKEGERFYLKCEGSGNPEPSTFTWQKKDGELGPQVTIDRAFLNFEMLNKSHNGVYLCQAGNGIGSQGQGEYTLLVQDPTAMASGSGVDHAVIGGVVAVIVFILLCLLIVLGRYLIRHKGTYLTHEAKGSDDAPDADTAIINAEGGTSGVEDKKEYFI